MQHYKAVDDEPTDLTVTTWCGTDRTRIRVVALAIIFAPDVRRYVVCRRRDATGREWHRPPGGGVEVGELARDAVAREIREELGAELVDPIQLGVLEDIYQLDGKTVHEIAWVFTGQVSRPALPPIDGCYFDESGARGWLEWRHSSGDEMALHPPGLQDLVDVWLASRTEGDDRER